MNDTSNKLSGVFNDWTTGALSKMISSKQESRKVVGYFCPYVPEELIIAAGMLPLRLTFAGEEDPVSAGEQFLTSRTCVYARACLGYQITQTNPYYQAVDAYCIALTCDAMKRNAEYLEKYFNKPVFVIALPHTHDRFRSRPQAVKYFQNELELMLKNLSELSQNRITNGDIRKAINISNSIRENIKTLFEYPLANESPIRWQEVLNIAHAGFVMDRADFRQELKRTCKALVKKSPVPNSNPRLLICGSIIGSGDYKILDIITEAGGNIVVDSVCTGSMPFRKNVTIYGLMGNPMPALAERYLYNVPCPCMTDITKRIKRILRLARDYRVDGVIYYSLKFCAPWRSEFGLIKKALAEELSIPTLLIETEYSRADTGIIRTKAEAFVEMIRGV